MYFPDRGWVYTPYTPCMSTPLHDNANARSLLEHVGVMQGTARGLKWPGNTLHLLHWQRVWTAGSGESDITGRERAARSLNAVCSDCIRWNVAMQTVLPEDFRTEVSAIDYSSPVTKINGTYYTRWAKTWHPFGIPRVSSLLLNDGIIT